MKLKNRTNNGITLIALVITIVVLLILAGVTIATLSGDNGILQRASEAKKDSNKAEAEETIKLLLSEVQIERNMGTKSLEILLEERFDTVSPDGENYIVTKNGYEAIVDKNGTLIGDIQKAGPRPVVDEASIKITTDGTTVAEDGTVQKGTPLKINFTATIEGGTISKIEPAVPYTTNGTEMSKEFTITGTTPNGTYTSKKTISVESKYQIDHSEEIVNIQQNGIKDTIKPEIGENKTIKEVREGNIPIPNGYTYIKGDKIGGAVIRENTTVAGPSTEQNPIEFVWVPVEEPTKMFGTDSQGKFGILYYFSTNFVSKPRNTKRVTEKYAYSEPEIVDEDTSSNINKQNLQDEFNRMAASVEKYGGFYIGRYESSFIESKGYLAPKKGVKSATSIETNHKNWYGLYEKQKLYKNNNIKGSMIWGCQYDAMLRWLQKNNIDVTLEIGEDRNKGLNQEGKEVGTTGTVEKDKIFNIYDLYGNAPEWTLATNERRYRIGVGGIYKWNYSVAHNLHNYPPTYYETFSTRATLYIP